MQLSIRSAKLGTLLLTLTMAACSQDGAYLTDARVREPIPGADKSVGYFELHNNTDQTLKFNGAVSQQIRAIELHTTINDDGVMRMRRLKTVEVPANESISFAPGGHHLMLFGIEALAAPVVITLVLDDTPVASADFDIMPLSPD